MSATNTGSSARTSRSSGSGTGSSNGCMKSGRRVVNESGEEDCGKWECWSTRSGFARRISSKCLGTLEKKSIPVCTSSRGEHINRLPAAGPAKEALPEGSPKSSLDTLSIPRDFSPLSRKSRSRGTDEVPCDWFDSCFHCNPEDLVMREVIGRGSSGVVHKAILHGQPVAVKTIKKPASSSSIVYKTPELDLLHGVSHPNLVQIYGVHEVVEMHSSKPGNCLLDSEGFLDSDFESGLVQLQSPIRSQAPALRQASRKVLVVMELCNHGSLWDAVKRGEFCLRGTKGAPLYSRVMEVAMEIACALQHLHELDIIHGDLKPQNVMLVESGELGKKPRAKVGDFGLCRIPQPERKAMTTFSWGTIDHMAPETLRDGKVHFATDVFSFAILLVELMTRRHPFHGMTTPAVMLGVIQGMRPEIPSTCPPPLANLVQECWHPNWHKRPTFTGIVHRLMNMMFINKSY